MGRHIGRHKEQPSLLKPSRTFHFPQTVDLLTYWIFQSMYMAASELLMYEFLRPIFYIIIILILFIISQKIWWEQHRVFLSVWWSFFGVCSRKSHDELYDFSRDLWLLSLESSWNLVHNTTERPQVVRMILSGDKTKMCIEDSKLLLYILMILTRFQMNNNNNNNNRKTVSERRAASKLV